MERNGGAKRCVAAGRMGRLRGHVCRESGAHGHADCLGTLHSDVSGGAARANGVRGAARSSAQWWCGRLCSGGAQARVRGGLLTVGVGLLPAGAEMPRSVP